VDNSAGDKVDKRLYKKCIKCRLWKARVTVVADDGEEVKAGFGKHITSSDGLQSICFACKNIANNKARDTNVTARIRHHTGTRCLTQLGPIHTPKNFVANLEDYLGYRISTLVKHLSSDLKEREGKGRKLRDALQEGYHIDHIHPLSKYKVLIPIDGDPGRLYRVDWDEFRRCWALENLSAIPGAENLAKGAKVTASNARTDTTTTTTTIRSDLPLSPHATRDGEEE